MLRKKKIYLLLLFFHWFLQCTIAHYEKHFIIVIPSYNNAQWYDRNLASVLAQNYSHFNVIYTDDCSSDNTGQLVENYLAHNDHENKITLIKNSIRKGALYNLYTMIYMCDDDSIIVTLDGDDWLPDENVLNRLNDVYSSEEIWLTYGQFKLSSGSTGWASPMPDYIVESNSFRDFQHLPTHLRTFYAWLFKQIKLEDLLYLGKFYPMTWDMVMMFPMIEMAGERHKFISDIMYIYNDNNAISDHNVSRQLQAYLAQIVKKKKRYNRLTHKPFAKQRNKKADAIIFAQDPYSLANTIESLKKYADGLGTISVLYKPLMHEQAEYDSLIYKYPEIEFSLIDTYRSNFKTLLFNIYKKTAHDYILFLKNKQYFEQPFSLSHIITYLEETSAYAFYFNLTAQEIITQQISVPFIECKENIIAWNFSLAQDKWSCANSLDCVLHKKTDILMQALQSNYDLTPNGLEAVWANEGNLDRLGLCFKETILSS